MFSHPNLGFYQCLIPTSHIACSNIPVVNTLLRWSHDPCFLVSYLVWPPSLSVRRTCDLLLTNRIWWTWLNVHDYRYVTMTYKIILPVTRVSPLLAAREQVGMLGTPCGRELQVAMRRWGRSPLTGSNKSNLSVPPLRELNTTNSHRSKEACPSLTEPPNQAWWGPWFQLCRGPSCAETPDSQNCGIIDVCCFKLLRLW